MNRLTKLFKLIEITRSQPQYGYALAGIKKNDLSDLAQHHYLVSFIAWQLASHCIAKGAKINLARVLEFSLVHDLGELFGGDISMPYARANPRARELAKAFESENQNFLSQFFGAQSANFKKLSQEILSAKSDEALICKCADYLEVSHYKLYMDKLTKGDAEMSFNAMVKKIAMIKDPVACTELKRFAQDWKKEMLSQKNSEIFEKSKF